jgi:hypothetical protein
MGPEAIRGRLSNLENILVFVVIKDNNRTKYQSHISNPFSYIDPPIITAIAGYDSKINQPPNMRIDDCSGDDNGGMEKKKNHSWMTTAAKKTKKTADCKKCVGQDGGRNANEGMRAEKKCLPSGMGGGDNDSSVDRGGACFVRARQPINARNNNGSKKGLLYDLLYGFLCGLLYGLDQTAEGLVCDVDYSSLAGVDIVMPFVAKKHGIDVDLMELVPGRQRKPSSKDGGVTMTTEKKKKKNTTTNGPLFSAECKVSVEMTTFAKQAQMMPPTSAAYLSGNDEKGGSCFHRVRPKGIAARRINNDVRGQREGMEMVERKKKREEEKKKKKNKVDFVLTMEQQRTGTNFPRKRHNSL